MSKLHVLSGLPGLSLLLAALPAAAQSFRISERDGPQTLLLNRILLVRKPKWRLVGTANVLWGSLSPRNIGIIPDDVDLDGVAARPFGALGDVPYVELGYGIENIFKFIRVDAIYCVTYRNRPGISTFGIKVSTQFKL